jgi:hypothetical protein
MLRALYRALFGLLGLFRKGLGLFGVLFRVIWGII